MSDESSSDESETAGPAFDPTGRVLQNHPDNNDYPDEDIFYDASDVPVSGAEHSDTEQGPQQKPQECGSQLVAPLPKLTTVFTPGKIFFLVGIDLEVGNTNRHVGGVVSLGAVFVFGKMVGNKMVELRAVMDEGQAEFDQKIKMPEHCHMQDECQRVHKITEEELKSKPEFGEVWDSFLAHVEGVLAQNPGLADYVVFVAHNGAVLFFTLHLPLNGVFLTCAIVQYRCRL